jgi:hypothetical protein
MDFSERIFDMKIKGYCCSQIIMAMGLEDMGRENCELVAAMRGLCNGMEEGKACGTLSAAACLICLALAGREADECREEFMAWFFDCFGGYDCDEITGGDPAKKISLCPSLVSASYAKLYEILFEDRLGGGFNDSPGP